MARSIFLALLLIAGPAFGHTGHGDSSHFLSGISHPLFGPDHLLAMIAVGLWAALSGGRALWALPATFIVSMLAGGMIGAGRAELALIEPMILASLIVIGAATALAARAPLWLSVLVIAPFGVAHGYAHGLEGPGGATYAFGFVIATAALHGLGIALGRFAPWAARIGGGLVALAGAALALS